MKAYTLPIDDNVEYPDVGYIKKYGLKPPKGERDYFKSKKDKNEATRRWKRRERIKNKLSIFDEDL